MVVSSYYDLTRSSTMAMRRAVWAATLSDVLAFALQRLPIIAHFSMLLLCFVGPLMAPHLLAFMLVAVHIFFVVCQSRTAYGVFRAWRGVQQHALRDWPQYFHEERAKMEACDSAQHVLPLDDVQQLVIVPAYKEDVATLRETLDVLASHPLARHSYYVCLAMEEREEGSGIKAQMLCDAYRAKGRFADISYSLHPGNIIGESAGKSSNVNWAARHMARRRGVSSLRAIYTVMDADSAFASDYFSACAVHFSLATPTTRRRMMFVPPTLFDRNCRDVPIFTRVTDIFWSCAGIGALYPSSSVKIPTSAYGVSMELARFCDFWDAGPESIGEDMHFYCKAQFETKGNVHAVTVYSPASQMNVVGKAGHSAAQGYLNDMGARWTQAVRHMWGSLDTGYCWHRLLLARFGRSVPRDGYVAVQTAPVDGSDDDDEDAATYIDSGSRTPSPSVTASTDATDDTDITKYSLSSRSSTPARKITQFDNHSSARYSSSMVFDEGKARAAALLNDDEDEIEAQVQDTYDEQSEHEKMRVWPIITMMARLYEAHFMIAQVTLMGFIISVYPSVIYRNGLVAMVDPYKRSCTFADCMLSIFESPFAAGVQLPADTPPGLHPSWMMPTILMCATKAAHILGGLAITATVLMCIFHDCYHDAATRRWATSDALYREWSAAQRSLQYQQQQQQQQQQLQLDADRLSPYNGGLRRSPSQQQQVKLSGRYLGVRPHQSCARRWPAALLDFAAIPAGIAYGIAPLLWAQANHLFTNKLTYTVSAKSKSVVIVPTINGSRTSVDRIRGQSFDLARVQHHHHHHHASEAKLRA